VHHDGPVRASDAGDLARTPALVLRRLSTDLRAPLEGWAATGDARRWFPGAYARYLQALERDIAGGRYRDPVWVVRREQVLVELYLAAVAADAAGGRPSRPWEVVFGAARRALTPPLAHLLLGLAAHTAYDLPLALVTVMTDAELGDARVLAIRTDDHRSLDELLATRVPVELSRLEGYGADIPVPDRWATVRYLRESRRLVWTNTFELSRARRRGPEAFAARLAALEEASAAKATVLEEAARPLLGFAVRGLVPVLPRGRQ
jgi:hypothetical protein